MYLNAEGSTEFIFHVPQCQRNQIWMKIMLPNTNHNGNMYVFDRKVCTSMSRYIQTHTYLYIYYSCEHVFYIYRHTFSHKYY
jgi:hypothetical protein